MEQEGKAAIAKTVLGTKETLIMIRAKDGQMLLNMLFFEEEVMKNPAKEVTEKGNAAELKMAKAIIEGMTGEFNPEEYRDEYRKKVQDAIEKKIAGKEIANLDLRTRVLYNERQKRCEMSKDKEARFELNSDFATRFIAKQYLSDGFVSHLHRNVEIYGVVDGEITVTIAGDRQVLTNGQMAAVNCVEVHEYDISGEAEIFYFHIGTTYLSMFISQCKQKLLPHWLLDAEYNKKLYAQIKELLAGTDKLSELKKHAVATNILSDIVDRYGFGKKDYDAQSCDLIESVIQYIYEHYSEDITLDILGKNFFIEPKTLSKKLSHFIGIDLRTYVSDVRFQKALQMMNDPVNHGVPKKDIIQSCGFKKAATFYRAASRNKIWQ